MRKLGNHLSDAQYHRDRKALARVIPQDGSMISRADIYLRAGEGLGPTLMRMAREGLISFSEQEGRHYVSQVKV